MNRLQTIGLFAGIFAIAMGAISLNDTSESFFMVSATPQSQEGIGMLGHVEYTVRDSADNIISYMQSDNVVTDMGKDCVGERMFDTTDTVDACVNSGNQFNYIGIGNFTNGVDALALALDADTGNANGCGTTTGGGEMWRLPVDPTFTSVAGSTIVTLDTTDPFSFTGSNDTTVMQSAIFNGPATHGPHVCTDANSATTDMFAIQELATSVGIAVSDGDSLSVKWTITIGA